MTNLNRAVAPDTQKINNLDFPISAKTIGGTGIPIYTLSANVDEVLRVEFVFDAGIAKQTQNTIAGTVNKLLTEGTKTRTAEEIADSLDFYGSYLQTRCGIDDAQLTLYCLKKHLNNCLAVVLDVVKNAQFPDSELNIYKKNAKQKLKVQQKKTSYICNKNYYESVFGATSPISTSSLSEDYDNISRETLINFHETNYANSMKYITVAGDVSEETINALEVFSGGFSPSNTKNSYASTVIKGENRIIKKEKSAQATLRLGCRIINRTHPDFKKLQLLNLVLGGYFGSRLMKNIREEKGLTYGINSVLESYLDDGCFYVDADVNSDKVSIAIAEIYKEIAILSTTPIPDHELLTAKNYLLGALLRSIDGPFSIMDRNKIMIDYGFDKDYYEEYIATINNTTPLELMAICKKYLNADNLVEVVCGG